jgi:hypothetical protein
MIEAYPNIRNWQVRSPHVWLSYGGHLHFLGARTHLYPRELCISEHFSSACSVEGSLPTNGIHDVFHKYWVQTHSSELGEYESP